MGYRHLKFPENSVFLVTGAAGFIGSNLCEAILDMGYTVRALDDLSKRKKKNVDISRIQVYTTRCMERIVGRD